MSVIIFILITAGMFCVLSSMLKLPPYSTTQRLRGVSGKTGITETLNQRLLLPVMRVVAPFIRIDDFKERRMKIKLERAGLIFTPKEYYARAVVMAVGTVIIGTLAAVAVMPSMTAVVCVLAIIVYFHFFGEVNDRLKEKDELIERELPKFIRAIVQGLKTEKDVIKLLETYGTIAEKGLQYDIEVLVLDLKSGNFENAMLDFDKRVGNAYMSRLTKALIAVNRGDNQEAALNHLLSDMSLLSHETMQRELNKRPGRVKMMVIPIVVIGIFTLFYVVGVNLFNSLGGIM
jgi:hypothetical protein